MRLTYKDAYKIQPFPLSRLRDRTDLSPQMEMERHHPSCEAHIIDLRSQSFLLFPKNSLSSPTHSLWGPSTPFRLSTDLTDPLERRTLGGRLRIQ